MKTETVWIKKIGESPFVEYEIYTRKNIHTSWNYFATTDKYNVARKLASLAKMEGM